MDDRSKYELKPILLEINRKKKSIRSCLTQDTACLGLVHGDDPQRCYGEGGGKGVHVWERM